MMTFICRSWSMPGPLVDRAVAHSGAAHARSETTSPKVAAKALDDALGAGRAAHVTVDAASLAWSGADPTWVGRMPMQLNVIGTLGEDLVVDAGGARVVSRERLAAARAAVGKEKPRLLTFAPDAPRTAPADAARQAAAYTAKSFRESPFQGFQGNFGLKGLQKAAKLMADAKDPKGWAKVFGSGPLAFRALIRTFDCAMLELTAPAGGRPFYAEFLEAAARLPGLAKLSAAAGLARESGERFEALADAAVAAGGDALAKAVEITERIDERRLPNCWRRCRASPRHRCARPSPRAWTTWNGCSSTCSTTRARARRSVPASPTSTWRASSSLAWRRGPARRKTTACCAAACSASSHTGSRIRWYAR
jgi:hypothetical protein